MNSEAFALALYNGCSYEGWPFAVQFAYGCEK